MFGFGSSTKSDGKMKRRKELDLKGEELLTFLNLSIEKFNILFLCLTQFFVFQ